jgi:hypothetical protein
MPVMVGMKCRQLRVVKSQKVPKAQSTSSAARAGVQGDGILEAEQVVEAVQAEAGDQQADDEQHLRPVPEALEQAEDLDALRCSSVVLPFGFGEKNRIRPWMMMPARVPNDDQGADDVEPGLWSRPGR